MVVKQIVFDHFEYTFGSGACEVVSKRGMKYFVPDARFAMSIAEDAGLKKGDKIKITLDEIGMVTSWGFVK
jgi:hypothetical protein